MTTAKIWTKWDFLIASGTKHEYKSNKKCSLMEQTKSNGQTKYYTKWKLDLVPMNNHKVLNQVEQNIRDRGTNHHKKSNTNFIVGETNL